MSVSKRSISTPEKFFGLFLGLGVIAIICAMVGGRIRGQIAPDSKFQDHHPEKALGVRFEPPSINFGTSSQARIMDHTFNLINESTSDVSIAFIQVSCSCTTVATNFIGKVLRVGEQMPVPVTLNTGTKQGPIKETLVIAFDHPGGMSQAEAVLRGRVEPEFFVERFALDFGILYPGQTATQSTVLRPIQMSGPPLAECETNFGSFTVSVKDQSSSITETKNSVITVGFSAPLLRERELFTPPLKLRTLSERIPTLEIALKAQVVPDVEITPRVVVLGPDHNTPETHFTVRTRLESRVIRALSISSEGTNVVQLKSRVAERPDWSSSHNFSAQTHALRGSSQFDVELEIRRGPGETEARRVSAQLTSLNIENTK